MTAARTKKIEAMMKMFEQYMRTRTVAMMELFEVMLAMTVAMMELFEQHI